MILLSKLTLIVFYFFPTFASIIHIPQFSEWTLHSFELRNSPPSGWKTNLNTDYTDSYQCKGDPSSSYLGFISSTMQSVSKTFTDLPPHFDFMLECELLIQNILYTAPVRVQLDSDVLFEQTNQYTFSKASTCDDTK
jgi:hypothetical protein